MAVGQRDAVRYADGKWSAPTQLDRGSSAGDGLASVSCTSAAFCVAGDGRGVLFTYSGSGWSGPSSVASSGLVALSCSAPSFCAALDTEGDALLFNGRVWSPPRTITGASQPLAIACTKGSVCMAVDGSSQDTFRLAGGAWSGTGSLNVSTPMGGSEPNVGSAVSCATATVCAALDNFGEAFTWVAGRWSDGVQFDHNLMDGSDAVSCPSSGFCMVVDGDGMTTTWNGRMWSDATRIDSPSASLTDVSCAAARVCVAVDSRGRALTYR